LLNFDADAAGVKAAQRAIGEVEEMAYRGDVQLRVLNIPDGKDPDEFLRHHSAADYRELIDAAPLWIDWQIHNLIGGKDLRQADQFQQTSQAVVKLLSDIANADTRTHYVRYCAEIFSNGDSRLVPLLAENLVTQVRRQRRTATDAQSQKQKASLMSSSGDESLGNVSLEESEVLLMRLFLHLPKIRQSILETLKKKDLHFAYSHHRSLWMMIRRLITESSKNEEFSLESIDLADILRNYASDNFSNDFVHSLLSLDEKSRRDILRAPLVMCAAINCMEKNLCEKRARHFLSKWQKSSLDSTFEEMSDYNSKYLAERRRIKELDEDRWTTFEDLASLPWVGEQYDLIDQ
jgi:DNA primase